MGWFRDLFWSEAVHHFFGCRIADIPDLRADADIRPATPADEPAVVRAFPLVPFARRLEDGDTAWLAFSHGVLVHQTWVSTRHAWIPQVEYDRRLAPGELYIYDCVTLAEFRGRGIYPATLAAAARSHLSAGRVRAVLGVLSGNKSSVRAAEKAGFRLEFDHHYFRFLGFSWQRETPGGPPSRA